MINPTSASDIRYAVIGIPHEIEDLKIKGSDGSARATPGDGRCEMRRRCAAAVRLGNCKEKTRDGLLRAGFAIVAMMSFCP